MEVDDLPSDHLGAEAPVPVGVLGFGGAHELAEDFIPHLRGDAAAGVGAALGHLAGTLSGEHTDPATGVGVLHRVVAQVVKDVLETIGVCRDLRKTSGAVEFQLQLVLAGTDRGVIAHTMQ